MDSCQFQAEEVGENHFELNLKYSFVLFFLNIKSVVRYLELKVYMREATNCILASCKTGQVSRNIL